MKLTEKERAEALERVKEYWEGLDDAGIFLVLGTARYSWEQARKRETEAEDLAAAAAEVRAAARITKKVIPLARRV